MEEKYILITAVVIMIIILALDFILSKGGYYQCHSCKKRFHKEDLEIKGWHLKEWVCPHCKHLNYAYDEED